MQAAETKLRRLIEGNHQYVVPLFQRPYSWGEKQWKTLWTDIAEQARHDDSRPHFFGTIVTTPARSVPQGVGKYLLIDGQQRLTTIQVLLSTLRDAAAAAGETRLRDRLQNQWLTNQYEEGVERLKVLPTQFDRPAFLALVEGGEPEEGKLAACRKFFRSRLEKYPVDRLESFTLAVLDRLSIVSITCDEHDNPQLIFESLNAKGEKLTPADLIRNFILMKVHVHQQESLYRGHWAPIQEALGENLTEFVRHYLMKDGRIVNEADVYFELKDRLADSNPTGAADFLADLHRHGLFYHRFVNAAGEPDEEIRAALDRLHQLKVTVAYPLLLRIFDARERGHLTREQVVEALETLESFVIRRAICGVPTNQLRRIFPPVFDLAGGAGTDLVTGLRRQLGGNRCPGDSEFLEALTTRPQYGTSDKNARIGLMLRRLEQSFGHKEQVPLCGAQIEHVMPQKLTKEWIAESGVDSSDTEELIHSLGNLTLTKYNQEMSNRPYREKRKELSASHFELNRHFASVPTWNASAIRERGRILGELCLGIWPSLDAQSEVSHSERVTPSGVRLKDVERPASTWREAFVALIELMERSRPGTLAKIADGGLMSAVVSRDPSRFPRSREEIGSAWVNTHGSARALRTWAGRMAAHFEIAPEDFEFLTE